MLLTGLSLSLIPIITIIIVCNRNYNFFLISGLLASATSFVIELTLKSLIQSDYINPFIHAFILTALIEELNKYYVSKYIGCFNLKCNFFICGMILGLGFGCAENLLYTFNLYNKSGDSNIYYIIILSRFFVPLFLHMHLGVFLLLSFQFKKIKTVGGFFLAVIFHGLNNFFAFTQTSIQSNYILLILLFFIVAFIYKQYKIASNGSLI